MPTDNDQSGLADIAALAPLLGGIALDAIATNAQNPNSTPGERASDIVNRAEHIHHLIMHPGATAQDIENHSVHLCTMLIANLLRMKVR